MTTTADQEHSAPRRAWFSVLARAPRDALAQRAAAAIVAAQVTLLRPPEVGLVMLRARICAHGDRFNLGEATVTRCVLQCVDTAQDTTGVGYVLGRDTERAIWVATLDALLQQPRHHERLMVDVITPLRALADSARATQHARTATSRVRFDTLQGQVEP